MPEISDVELDQQLAELERDLGPVLRRISVSSAMRPGFAAELRSTLMARRVVHIVGQRAWAALAAMLVGGVIVSVALFANRPQPASASEVLGQLQAEAIGFVGAPAPGCEAAPDKLAQPTGGVAGVQAGRPSTTGGPATPGDAAELSDKLAAALGVSGDRVRTAMLATVRADLPTSLPPDPMDGIARQLGLSREQVCSAFLEGPGAITGFQAGTGPAGAAPPPEPSGGKMINLSTMTADQLKDQAQKLGVSPDRLLAAVKASALLPAPGPKLSPDEIIQHFAQNLGMPEDRVRAAIAQVEGNNRFYFAVPLPGLSR